MSDNLERSKNGDKSGENDSELEREKEPEEIIKKSSKPVIIRAEVYKTIILYASRYANNAVPKKDWKEIYGVLFGYSDDDFIYVEKAEALTHGHDTDVQLEPKHYIFIDEIQRKLDKDKNGLYMVGWFHSHPGLKLFFSYIDLINQLGFQQNNPDFCGLVFDHTYLGKKKEEKIIGDTGEEHGILKYDTGFEIYRITNVNMDINDPKFDANYHKVDYIVDGLNKFFFANVLSELSSLVSAGKPLQSSYGEFYEIETSYKDNIKESEDETFKKNKLVEIPISEDIVFDVDDLFFDDRNKTTKKKAKLIESAEQAIYEGNLAFEDKNTFMGVEKYKEGIEKYRAINDFDRVLELLRNLSENCISTNHEKLAEEFAEELYDLALKQDNIFYRAEANYLIGFLGLKKSDSDILEYSLKKIQEASIDYEKAEDFAGAGKCYYKIGMIYQSRLNETFNACLFYVEAIKNHNKAILKGHPLRKSLWSKPELLFQRILELKETVEELIPNIENSNEREKINVDLNSINLNF